MEGLVTGRIVYLVLSARMADEINRRRTTGASIRERMDAVPAWPTGAMAHIGTEVMEGDIVPAMVVKVLDGVQGEQGGCNLKANLDGTDQYWAVGVPYSADKRAGTWGWMFAGQAGRYDPTKTQPGG